MSETSEMVERVAKAIHAAAMKSDSFGDLPPWDDCYPKRREETRAVARAAIAGDPPKAAAPAPKAEERRCVGASCADYIESIQGPRCRNLPDSGSVHWRDPCPLDKPPPAKEDTPAPCAHEWERRLVAEQDGDDLVGKHAWYVCIKCGKVEARPMPDWARKISTPRSDWFRGHAYDAVHYCCAKPPWKAGPMPGESGNPRGNEWLREVWRKGEERTEALRRIAKPHPPGIVVTADGKCSIRCPQALGMTAGNHLGRCRLLPRIVEVRSRGGPIFDGDPCPIETIRRAVDCKTVDGLRGEVDSIRAGQAAELEKICEVEQRTESNVVIVREWMNAVTRENSEIDKRLAALEAKRAAKPKRGKGKR